jgi:Fic family protein
VHPFSDGNGRVICLFTDTALKAAGMKSSELWSLSRGLARASVKYKWVLTGADATRRGDLDGRSVLSEKRLTVFCEFMLDTALN